MSKSFDDGAPAGYRYVYCKGFFHKASGKYITAESCGKKAFRLLVKV